MSYLVLARKWRPTQFAEVTGQEHVTRTLSNAIRLNRVAHSFLFTGARGVGKTSTARILAKALNCAEGPLVEPCGKCASCLEIPEGRSLDVLEIDGASNRGIGEIRELRDGVRYAPSRDKHKIYIIDEVHMLTQEAFNALLKTLEEPPPHVIFIFATTEPQKIPVTILSRCQRFDFKRVPARTLIGRLAQILEAEGIQMAEEGLHMVARESEGSVRDALSLLDRIIASGGNEITAEDVSGILGVADRGWLHQLFTVILNRQPGEAIRIVNEVNHYGYDLKHFAHEAVHFLRDLLVIRLGGAGAQKVTDLAESEFQSMTTLVQERDPEDLERFLKIAIQGIHDMTHAPFPQIVLEAMVIRMASLRPLRPMDDLIKRLMILERALPEGAVLPPLSAVEQGIMTGASAPAAASVMGQQAVPDSPSPDMEQMAAPPVANHEIIPVQTEPIDVPPKGESPPPPPVPQPPAPQPPVEAKEISPPEVLQSVQEAAMPAEQLVEDEPAVLESGTITEQANAASEEVPAPVTTPVEVEAKSDEAKEDTGSSEMTPVEEVEASWTSQDGKAGLEAFMAHITAVDAPLAGELAQGKLELSSGEISVRFRSSLFAARFAEGSPSRERLNLALQTFFSDQVTLLIDQLLEKKTEDETHYEEGERVLQEQYTARREEVKDHPAVQNLVDAFEGEVMQIRLLGVDD